MTLRFRRSVRIFPGVNVNLGLHGAGVSVGARGLHAGINRRGAYSSIGIPGSGLYLVHHFRAAPGQHPRVVSGAGGCGPLVLIIAVLIILAVARG